MTDSPRRVAITGIGAITPIGIGREACWSGIRAERSAVGSVTRFDPSIFRSQNAAEVNDFRPEDHLEARRARRLDRFGQFSVAGARLVSDFWRISVHTRWKYCRSETMSSFGRPSAAVRMMTPPPK